MAYTESTEQQMREELAALYRLVAHFRMTDLIDTHISAPVSYTHLTLPTNREV